MIPRLQGIVGQIEEPDEYKGQFAFEVYLSFMGDNQEPKQVFMSKPFKQENEAHHAMRKIIRDMIKMLQEIYGHEPTGEAIDLKTNKIVNIGMEN